MTDSQKPKRDYLSLVIDGAAVAIIGGTVAFVLALFLHILIQIGAI